MLSGKETNGNEKIILIKWSTTLRSDEMSLHLSTLARFRRQLFFSYSWMLDFYWRSSSYQLHYTLTILQISMITIISWRSAIVVEETTDMSQVIVKPFPKKLYRAHLGTAGNQLTCYSGEIRWISMYLWTLWWLYTLVI